VSGGVVAPRFWRQHAALVPALFALAALVCKWSGLDDARARTRAAQLRRDVAFLKL
jgi:hypothetical protein